MALLREIGPGHETSPWRHWIVGLEQIGRVGLPLEARQLLGVGVRVRAVSRDHMLVLHHGGVGATLPIDGRGRIVLPAWFRGAVRSSRSVLVAARLLAPATVVLAPIGLLDDLVCHVVGEVE
jgi:hypothetical protein